MMINGAHLPVKNIQKPFEKLKHYYTIPNILYYDFVTQYSFHFLVRNNNIFVDR